MATIQVRLPMPTLKAAVKSIRIGSGSHRTVMEVGEIAATEEKLVSETSDGACVDVVVTGGDSSGGEGTSASASDPADPAAMTEGDLSKWK